MADGHENLIPTNRLTEEERREMASRAGKASVKARREKKTLRECVRLFGELPVEGKNARAMADLGIPVEEHNRLMQISVSLYQKAMKGDVAAFNAIRDIIGEKPTDKTEITGALDQRIEISLIHGDNDPVTTEDEIT